MMIMTIVTTVIMAAAIAITLLHHTDLRLQVHTVLLRAHHRLQEADTRHQKEPKEHKVLGSRLPLRLMTMITLMKKPEHELLALRRSQPAPPQQKKYTRKNKNLLSKERTIKKKP